MDYTVFISIIKKFPQVWDRNSTGFRERDQKKEAWDRIGEIMQYPAYTCKNAFKSLREKYVREREKQSMLAEKYLPWAHLESLSFLDPHIVLRKQSPHFDDSFHNSSNGSLKAEFSNHESFVSQMSDMNAPSEFDKSLIALVKKATPIWDRKSNGYPSKQLKYELWKTIAHSLGKDVGICMTRWKGLREKYIRQKTKFHEGEAKWEFLEDMAFLDHVIQYRRKQSETLIEARCSPTALQIPVIRETFPNSNDDGSSSTDFVVKNETFDTTQDSFYEAGSINSGRKRSASDYSESSSDKKEKVDIMEHRSPEQMFGDLVAAMLAKKNERDKNYAMLEIMKVLTK